MKCRACGGAPMPGVGLWLEPDLCSACAVIDLYGPTMGDLDVGELAVRKRTFDGQESDESTAQRVIENFLKTGRL